MCNEFVRLSIVFCISPSLRAKFSFNFYKIRYSSISNIAGIMQEKQVDNLAKTLETPIEEVDFSVRAFNCLKRHGIHTLQDLVNMKEVEVTKIRNLGKKSLKEVIDKVADLGLQFKE